MYRNKNFLGVRWSIWKQKQSQQMSETSVSLSDMSVIHGVQWHYNGHLHSTYSETLILPLFLTLKSYFCPSRYVCEVLWYLLYNIFCETWRKTWRINAKTTLTSWASQQRCTYWGLTFLNTTCGLIQTELAFCFAFITQSNKSVHVGLSRLWDVIHYKRAKEAMFYHLLARP